MAVLAVDIGGTKFTLALFEQDEENRNWALTRRSTHIVDRGGGRDWILSRIEELAAAWQDASIERIGVGFGGPVDYASQQVILSTHVGGWDGFDLCGWLARLWNAPAIMDNDANVGALGEGLHGAGRGFRPMFYMTLSTGVGGGILTPDGILRGADSYAGEVGHICIDPAGPSCLCGSNGCLERMCCGLWLERDHGKPASELLADQEFVSAYVVKLARGLKAVVMLLNPARIVIGGGISKAGDALFGPLRAELRRQVTPWSRARLDVAPAALVDDSVLWGALELALAGFGGNPCSNS